MSVINGIWHKDGRPLEKHELLQQASHSAKYAPDCLNIHRTAILGMSFQGFHTHERSAFEPGPYKDDFGNCAVLDGRIDNAEQLAELLEMSLQKASDTAIVLAAFRKWGDGCFDRIIGDWAVAIWDGADRSLYLARDHAGTRALYYAETEGLLAWSTYPESFLELMPDSELNHEYLVRYLALLPAGHRTPYARLYMVPQGHFLRFSKHSPVRKTRYWRPVLRESGESHSEEWYQEVFLDLLRRAVKRRVASSNNLICHLSGGMDSTAIVCVADLLAQDGEIADQVKTLSFYDPTEPNWDDHLYYGAAESQRGQTGIHVPGSLGKRSFDGLLGYYPLPGADGGSIERETEFEGHLGPGQVRSIVAGHGGDELLGGRPDPIPELADYLFRFAWMTFLSSAFDWARCLRRPIIALAQDASRFIWNQYPNPKRASKELPPWMDDVRLQNAEESELRLWQSASLGHLPSELDKQDTWENLCDTLPHLFHAHTSRYEYRYPLLDRDLVEFLLVVPQRNMRRPDRRRYMMRQTLRGIVPQEILERRRKAYVSRGPVLNVQRNIGQITSLISTGELARRGLINRQSFLQTLDMIAHGDGTSQWLPSLLRTIELELWINQTAIPPSTHAMRSGVQDLQELCLHDSCRNSD